MTSDQLSRFASFVVELERISASPASIPGFAEKALALLAAFVHADGGAWAQGPRRPASTGRWKAVDVWNLDPRRARRVLSIDPAASIVPGEGAPLVAVGYFDDEAMIEGRLSLVRGNNAAQDFAPSARRFVAAALPLMRQARVRWERERILAEVRPHSFMNGECFGIADLRGDLVESSDAFAEALAREFPAWRGPRLPSRLLASLVPFGGDRREFFGAQIRVRCHAISDRCLLDVDTQPATQRLSASERRVLAAFSRCPNLATIAEELGLSQGTVRVHIQAFYRKLGVRSRVELMKVARSMPADPQGREVVAANSRP